MADTFEERTISETTTESSATQSILDAPIVCALALLLLCSTVYIRRVPKFNKALVGEGAPLRLVATLSGQFDYLLSIACIVSAFYVLFLY